MTLRSLLPLLPALLVAMPASAAAPEIPAPFIGLWTETPANCGGEDTTGLTIAADSLAFYEAKGVVKSVKSRGPDAVSLKLAYTGEGKSWRETDELSLAADGQSLTIKALGKTFALKRCPATSPVAAREAARSTGA